MACDPLLIWRPVPVGSTFKASAAGDENLFNVLIAVTKNSQAEPPLRHHDLVPGPATIPINAGDRYVLDVILNVFSTPDSPVTYEMSVVDENNKVVTIGGVSLQCDTSMATTGTQAIKILLSAV